MAILICLTFICQAKEEQEFRNGLTELLKVLCTIAGESTASPEGNSDGQKDERPPK